jgi:hypothetical protein
VKKTPVIGSLWQFSEMRPRLAAWIVLSLGIVILLLVEARDVGLLVGQWLALIVASVLVAGLCIWIVSWEDSEEQPAKTNVAPTATKIETNAEQLGNTASDAGETTPATPDKAIAPDKS